MVKNTFGIIFFNFLYRIRNFLPFFCKKSAIVGQDFVDGKTIFLVNQSNKIVRKSAKDLFGELPSYNLWNKKDLTKIITTATHEQMLDDLLHMEKK